MSMMWAAGAVAVSTTASLYSSNSAANSQMAQASSASEAHNKSLTKQYLHNTVRNSYKAGLLNVQLGLGKKQAAQEGFDQTVQAKAALGMQEAGAAATGTVGASVDAVSNDIDMKLGEVQAVSAENFEQMLLNYNNELEGLKINATAEAISTDPMKVKYEGPSTGAMFGGALMQGAAQLMSMYAGSKMKLGLGNSPTVSSPVSSAGLR